MIRKIIRDKLKESVPPRNVWDDGGAAKRKKEKKKKVEANHPEVNLQDVLKRRVKYNPPTPPSLLCLVCSDPVYFYEYEDDKMCLWCRKLKDAA